MCRSVETATSLKKCVSGHLRDCLHNIGSQLTLTNNLTWSLAYRVHSITYWTYSIENNHLSWQSHDHTAFQNCCRALDYYLLMNVNKHNFISNIREKKHTPSNNNMEWNAGSQVLRIKFMNNDLRHDDITVIEMCNQYLFFCASIKYFFA